jgi:tRNA threonylcarbamoyladenosine biosynthesis protein TsaB
MLLLALDTSTRQASVALCSEDVLLGEYTWYVGNNHSVELLERIRRLLAECRKSMPDIDGVAVATGPGSFNGLRVAVSTAKALAFALKRPLVGVSTLDSIAAQQQQWEGPICSILEAGRSDLYAACYLFDKIYNGSGEVTYQMEQLSDYLLLSPQQLASYLQEHASTWFGVPGERKLPPFLFSGEISAASHQALYAQMQDKSLFVNSVLTTRHASILATLALQRLQSGKEDDPLLLEPLYLRRPSITTSARKQPLLGGKSNRLAGHRPTGPSESEREEGAIRH